MSATIIISDDEEDDEHNTPIYPVLYRPPENKPVNPFPSRNEISSWHKSSPVEKTFRALIRQSNTSSSSRINASTTEKQVADTTPGNPKAVLRSSQVSPVPSRRWPSPQREASSNTSSNSLEVIDLTTEDVHTIPQKGLPQPRVIGTIPEGSQSSVRQIGPTNTRIGNPDPVVGLSSLLQAEKLSSPRSRSSEVEVHGSNQPDRSSRREAEKVSESALQGRLDKSSDIPNSFCRSGRTLPWASENPAVTPIQGNFARSVTTTLQFSKEKSSKDRDIRNLISDTCQSGSATEFVQSTEKGGRGDDTSRSSPTFSRPRLKLNSPKRSASELQDHMQTSRRSQERRSRNLHAKRHEHSTASRVSPLDSNRTLGILARRVEQDRTADSDSDDASVRMQRSIDQALAKYSKQVKAKVQPQGATPVEQTHRDLIQETGKEDPPILGRQSGQGSPELGENDPPVHDVQDVDVMSRSQSKAREDVPDLLRHSERLPTSDNVEPSLSHPKILPAPAQMATETLVKVVDTAGETHQSTTIQELPPAEPTVSKKCQNIKADLKLLEAIFKPLVEEMRGDQEDLISGFLSRARNDAMEFSGPKIDQNLPDPFSATTVDSNSQSSLFDPVRHVRLDSRVVNTRSKAPSIDLQAVAFKSEVSKIPKYNSIVRLASNVLAPNDKELRYLPYFPSEEEKDGADASEHRRREELLEGFDNRIKFLPEERRCVEQAGFWREHLECFLEEVGCSCVDIMYYLLHDEDAAWRPECELSNEALSRWLRRETCCDTCGTKFEGDVWDRLSVTLLEHRPDEETLAIAGLVCSVFSRKAKSSIWHIVSNDEQVQLLIDETETRFAAEQKPKGPTEQSLCMLCHVFDCPTHGAYMENESKNSNSDRGDSSQRDTDQDCSSESSESLEPMGSIRQTVGLPERPKLEGQQHRCSLFCVDLQARVVDILGLRKDGDVSGNYNSKQIKETGNTGFGDDETCSESCFWDTSKRSERTIVEIIQSDASRRYVNWSDKDVVLYKSMLASCAQTKRGPCIMAITLARPCSAIFEEMLSDIHIIPHPISELDTNEAKPSSTSPGYRYKDLSYWFESSQTYDHHKRRPFVPCSHSGPCQRNSDCSCWTNKVACEWICGCDGSCSRRFQGCRCVARGAKVCFKDSSCDCFALNRECDPWLCGKCGVLEVLDPVNRRDDSILKGRCRNAMIQRGVPKRTLKGPSEVHGWGLFAGTDIRANEFIGEYKGEVISEEESNRRGLVYHYRGIEYLFRLNKEQEIDSSRAGNKMRFINNSERVGTINIYPQPMLCNGVQRIGLFAKRNLASGEEMFFRYGYPESITKNFWEKEDLEAGTGFSSMVEQEDNAERVTTKGLKSTATAAKPKPRRGVGKHIKKAPKRFAASKRHTHFLGHVTNADNKPEASTSQPFPDSQFRSKKRKRIPSSPVIDETILDLPEDAEPKDESILASDPFGPSSSSLSLDAHASTAASDHDEEYENEREDDEDEADTTSSAASASEVETDDDISDGGKTRHSAIRRTVPSRQSTRRKSSKTATRPLRTLRTTVALSRQAAENARMSAENREKFAANTGPDTDIDVDTNPTLTALPNTSSTTSGDHLIHSTSITRTSRIKSPSNTSRGSKSSNRPASPHSHRHALPYMGKKRGRPFGWRRGVNFK